MEPFILIAIAAIAIVAAYVVWARRSHPESTRRASRAETWESGRDEQRPLLGKPQPTPRQIRNSVRETDA